jgi:hypothetical protein
MSETSENDIQHGPDVLESSSFGVNGNDLTTAAASQRVDNRIRHATHIVETRPAHNSEVETDGAGCKPRLHPDKKNHHHPAALPKPTSGVTVRNPYGKKSSSLLPMSTKSLFPNPLDLEGHPSDIESTPNDNSTSTDHNGAKEKDSTDGSVSQLASLSGHNHVLKVVDTTDGRNNVPKQEQSQPMSNLLQPWQRLPSQNLSFGSAEILSISECVQHSPLYFAQKVSIRCTGRLEQVVYGYPPIGKMEKSPVPLLSICLSDPLFPFYPQNSIPSPKRSSFPTTTPPQLWVIFRTPEYTGRIHKFNMGDLVTVLGELILWKTLTVDHHHQYVVQARLVIPVPPTSNLSLQWEALLVRRRFLIETRSIDKNNTNNQTTTSLQPGCGPPPYTGGRSTCEDPSITIGKNKTS